MKLQYIGLKEINGPLVVIDHVSSASYDEMVQINLDDGSTRMGRIVQIEGEKVVIQVFEGTVIAKKHGGVAETFTVRRVSHGCGVERVFPLHSPNVDKVEIVRQGRVRRAKLYYLRDRVGKAAKVKSKIR